jgi:hypothetical protein
MKRILPRSRYGQRWQAETTNSMLKRLLGSSLRARSYWSQCRELILRALTLNTMILRQPKVFDRAGSYRFEDRKRLELRQLVARQALMNIAEESIVPKRVAFRGLQTADTHSSSACKHFATAPRAWAESVSAPIADRRSCQSHEPRTP